MNSYKKAKLQAEHDIRLELKSEGKVYINASVRQLRIGLTYELIL